jgi:methylthioribose-1-phosphate isomerase
MLAKTCVAEAIVSMQVRGAPLIGVARPTAGAGACARTLRRRAGGAASLLHEARPTAVNLRWALDRVRAAVCSRHRTARAAGRLARGRSHRRRRRALNRALGAHGATLIEQAHRAHGDR